MDSARLDGNAAAGELSALFAFDVTLARTTCAGCRDTRAVAELHVYLRAAGTVLRCVGCGAVLVRLVRAPDRAWLDLRGVHVLEVDLPPG